MNDDKFRKVLIALGIFIAGMLIVVIILVTGREREKEKSKTEITNVKDESINEPVPVVDNITISKINDFLGTYSNTNLTSSIEEYLMLFTDTIRYNGKTVSKNDFRELSTKFFKNYETYNHNFEDTKAFKTNDGEFVIYVKEIHDCTHKSTKKVSKVVAHKKFILIESSGRLMCKEIELLSSEKNNNQNSKGILFANYQINDHQNSDIYKMNPDGSERVKLIDRGGAETQARWSDDLTKIVFTSTRSTTRTPELFIANADGTNQAQLTNSSPQFGNFSGIFRTSTLIWYSNASSTGVTEIWEIDTDGSRNHQSTNIISEGKSGDIYDFNSSKSKVLYYKQRSSWSPTGEIYIANSDWSGEVQLTNNRVVDAAACFSPNDNKIVFYRSESQSGYEAPFNIYIMNSDGSQQIRLTDCSGRDGAFSPRFSPDGTKIAYCYYNGKQHDIYVMNMDGSNSINITNTSNINEILSDWR